jgi:hypothetical protein
LIEEMANVGADKRADKRGREGRGREDFEGRETANKPLLLLVSLSLSLDRPL